MGRVIKLALPFFILGHIYINIISGFTYWHSMLEYIQVMAGNWIHSIKEELIDRILTVTTQGFQ